MRIIARKLQAGLDLKRAVAAIVAEEGLKASVIMSAVGGLSKARIRMPGAHDTNDNILEFEGPFEIVSLVGIPQGSMHLHISFSDQEGKVFGGHLKEGCIIRQTLELALLEDETKEFKRTFDPATNFSELVIHQRGSTND